MRLSHRSIPFLLVLTLFVGACAEQAGSATGSAPPAISKATPTEVGLSEEVIAQIVPAMQELIDEHRTGGIMTLVARDGRMPGYAFGNCLGKRNVHN